MIEFVLDESGDKPVWTIDGLPVYIGMYGPSYHITATNVRITHVINEPESPDLDKNHYVFASADGTNIDSISLLQSWIRNTGGLKRYESQSFPMDKVVLIPEDASVMSCFAIQSSIAGAVCKTRIPLTDYLTIRATEKTSGTEQPA